MLRKKRPSPYRAALSVSGFSPYQFVGHLARDVGLENLALTAFAENDQSLMEYQFIDRYIDPELYLLAEVLSKFPYRHVRVDKRKAAVDRFLATEVRLRGINDKLFDRCPIGSPLRTVLDGVQKRIAKRVRPFTASDVLEVMELPKRATYCTSRAFSDRRLKVKRGCYSVSRRMSTALAPLIPGTCWSDVLDQSIEVSSVLLDTVPKKATTDRTIGKEPTLNAAFQRGIGVLLQHRLMSVGVNLRDQSLNRRLAYVGSLDGSLATIDLTDASASISCGLVFRTIPEWLFDLLYESRVDTVQVKNEVLGLEQWSGMGNGYTFELESLIFWGLVSEIAASKGVALNHTNFGIYGDDIICPVELVPHIAEVFQELGLLFNKDKTHATGAFRESCGGSYLSGKDITPFYVRPELDGKREVRDWSWLRFSKLWYQFFLYVRRRYPGFPCESTASLAFPHTYGYLCKVAERCELERGYAEDDSGGFLWSEELRHRRFKKVCTSIVTEVLTDPCLLNAWLLSGRSSYSHEEFPVREKLRWCTIRGAY